MPRLIKRVAAARGMVSQSKRPAIGVLLRDLSLAVAIALGLAGWAPPALADSLEEYSFDIVGKSVVLQMDDDYCRIEGGDNIEDAVLTLIERMVAPSSRLVALWMDCTGLSALKRSESDDFRRLLAVAVNANRKTIEAMDRTPRKVFIERFHAKISNKTFLDKVSNNTTEKLAQKDIDVLLAGDVFEALDEDERSALRDGMEELRDDMLAGNWGIFPLGRDDVAAYVGFSFPLNEEEKMAAVSAATLVKRLPLTFFVLDMNPSRRIYRELRDEVRGVVEQAVIENEG